MQLQELIYTYLNEYPLISVASCHQNTPWTCNLYFAFDEELNLYFISKTGRRHSEELRRNPNVAATICKPYSKPFIDPARGIQLEGKAIQIEDPLIAEIAFALYMNRFPDSIKYHKTVTDVTGAADRRIYQIMPSRIVLFDEENFSANPQQVLKFER
jgi:uncharacterized protein YhbP (UPF0306 family)